MSAVRKITKGPPWLKFWVENFYEKYGIFTASEANPNILELYC